MHDNDLRFYWLFLKLLISALLFVIHLTLFIRSYDSYPVLHPFALTSVSSLCSFYISKWVFFWLWSRPAIREANWNSCLRQRICVCGWGAHLSTCLWLEKESGGRGDGMWNLQALLKGIFLAADWLTFSHPWWENYVVLAISMHLAPMGSLDQGHSGGVTFSLACPLKWIVMWLPTHE